jgi:hypothetical protein
MTEHCEGRPVLVIDGARFSDFEGFTRESSLQWTFSPPPDQAAARTAIGATALPLNLPVVVSAELLLAHRSLRSSPWCGGHWAHSHSSAAERFLGPGERVLAGSAGPVRVDHADRDDGRDAEQSGCRVYRPWAEHGGDCPPANQQLCPLSLGNTLTS